MRDRDELAIPPVQHKGRRLDQRQDRACVHLEGGPQERLDRPGAGGGALEPRQPAAEPPVAGAARRLHRDHDLGPPELVELGQDRLGDLGGYADRVVVGGQVPGGGVGQDERASAFRLGPGEEDRHRVGIDLGQQGRLLRANLVQDSNQVLGVRLPWGQRVQWQGIGGAGAAAVEHDQPGERGQRAQEQGDPGVLPGHVDVAEASSGHHQVGWALPQHLVGDPVAPQPRVVRLRLHRCLRRGKSL